MFAHEALGTALREAYPDVPVISEEDAEHQDERPATYWLIDPIDGTASWSSGFPGFVCQIARIHDGSVDFSVIHAPVLNRTWTCAPGSGAYLNGIAMPRLGPVPADEQVRVIDNAPEPHGVAAAVMAWLGTEHYRECGSIGLKAALVATGEADVFVKDVVVRDWDVAPALALLREVGGDLRLGDGGAYLLTGAYAKPAGVLATGGLELGERIGAWLGAGPTR